MLPVFSSAHSNNLKLKKTLKPIKLCFLEKNPGVTQKTKPSKTHRVGLCLETQIFKRS